jgi:hypothetical protein
MRRFLRSSLAVFALLLALFAIPAAAGAALEVGPDCTFERGISTCTTATLVATAYPLSGSGAGTVADGSPVARFCQYHGADLLYYAYDTEGAGTTLTFTERVTTTTVRYGVPESNGKLLSAASTTTLVDVDIVANGGWFAISCYLHP